MNKLVLIAVMMLTNSCSGQYDFEDQKAMSMLREFYTQYNKVWSTESGLKLKHKIDSLQNIYCTVKLLKEIREQNLDHDVLTADISTDMRFLNTLKIVRNPSESKSFVVSYTAYSIDKHSKKEYKEEVKINLTVIQTKGFYKIDSVDY